MKRWYVYWLWRGADGRNVFARRLVRGESHAAAVRRILPKLKKHAGFIRAFGAGQV